MQEVKGALVFAFSGLRAKDSLGALQVAAESQFHVQLQPAELTLISICQLLDLITN